MVEALKNPEASVESTAIEQRSLSDSGTFEAAMREVSVKAENEIYDTTKSVTADLHTEPDLWAGLESSRESAIEEVKRAWADAQKLTHEEKREVLRESLEQKVEVFRLLKASIEAIAPGTEPSDTKKILDAFLEDAQARFQDPRHPGEKMNNDRFLQNLQGAVEDLMTKAVRVKQLKEGPQGAIEAIRFMVKGIKPEDVMDVQFGAFDISVILKEKVYLQEIGDEETFGRHATGTAFSFIRGERDGVDIDKESLEQTIRHEKIHNYLDGARDMAPAYINRDLQECAEALFGAKDQQERDVMEKEARAYLAEQTSWDIVNGYHNELLAELENTEAMDFFLDDAHDPETLFGRAVDITATAGQEAKATVAHLEDIARMATDEQLKSEALELASQVKRDFARTVSRMKTTLGRAGRRETERYEESHALLYLLKPNQYHHIGPYLEAEISKEAALTEGGRQELEQTVRKKQEELDRLRAIPADRLGEKERLRMTIVATEIAAAKENLEKYAIQAQLHEQQEVRDAMERMLCAMVAPVLPDKDVALEKLPDPGMLSRLIEQLPKEDQASAEELAAKVHQLDAEMEGGTSRLAEISLGLVGLDRMLARERARLGTLEEIGRQKEEARKVSADPPPLASSDHAPKKSSVASDVERTMKAAGTVAGLGFLGGLFGISKILHGIEALGGLLDRGLKSYFEKDWLQKGEWWWRKLTFVDYFEKKKSHKPPEKQQR